MKAHRVGLNKRDNTRSKKSDVNFRKEFPHLVACEHVFNEKAFPLSEALVNGSVL